MQLTQTAIQTFRDNVISVARHLTVDRADHAKVQAHAGILIGWMELDADPDVIRARYIALMQAGAGRPDDEPDDYPEGLIEEAKGYLELVSKGFDLGPTP